MKQIVDRAFSERYGVAAINVVNDLTLEAVPAAAVERRAPVIVQTSVKTVRSIGMDLLFARGCAKVNISTALKVSYMQSSLAFLRQAEERDTWDPPSLFRAVRAAVMDMAAGHMRRFGSAGKAW